jgi:two-component system cell cycle response regulator DivK
LALRTLSTWSGASTFSPSQPLDVTCILRSGNRSMVKVTLSEVANFSMTRSSRKEAENGEQALAAVTRQRPDLILMDIQLPIMDGYEATRRIKADPALKSIPIIAVTSYAPSGEEQKARAAGVDDYVPKPYSPRHLLAKIRQYLA